MSGNAFKLNRQETMIISKNPAWPSHSYQEHENDVAQMVIVSKPGLPKFMGSMHPAGSLYERPVNVDIANEQHNNFVNVLRSKGIVVLDVKDILMMDTDHNVRARIDLEELASKKLKYQLAQGSDSSKLKKEEEYYLGDVYKMKVIEFMSSSQLVDIILTNPTVHVAPSQRDTHFTAAYSFEPLSNLIFTRDQQVTTRRGIVMARLSSVQRQHEVQIMQFCFKKLGLNVIGEIPENGRLEGGDFYPAGKNLCFIGIGLRSNQEAVNHMLENDLFGTRRVAVVKDLYEQSQDRMHLDCVFNILSDTCCLMYEEMIGENSPVKRLVDEYSRESDRGPYTKSRENIEFSQYLKENKYEIIPISQQQQLNYGCNCLNLGNGNIICINREVARKIARSGFFAESTTPISSFSTSSLSLLDSFPSNNNNNNNSYYNSNYNNYSSPISPSPFQSPTPITSSTSLIHTSNVIQYVPFDAITSMYGGVHCASQVVTRQATKKELKLKNPTELKLE